MPTSLAPALIALPAAAWQARAQAHRERAEQYTEPFLQRRGRGQKHPVEDFLFTYYTLTPGQMKRWHPGPGTVLLDAPERQQWKHYRLATEAELREAGLPQEELTAQCGRAVLVDTADFRERRASVLGFTRDLLSRTAAKPGNFGCFGMHEWAMAYRSEENGHRHEYLDLRLGAEGTDQVVEGHRITCTHFDAYRFFQPQAVEMNQLRPTRENQREMEQPGCLHANMDLYKWTYKLLPVVDSELLMDCFELAREIRETDMRAAPYQLRDWGYEPIPVETPQGKQQYARRQREFAARSVELRHRVLAVLDRALGE